MKTSLLRAPLAVLAMMLAAPAGASAATTFVVNSTADAQLEGAATTCKSTEEGKCTLRAAVELGDTQSREAGAEPITIEVPEGTYVETLGSLYVEGGANLTIAGAGAGKTILDGNETSEVIRADSGATLTLTGLTIRHGKNDEGGGIETLSGSHLTVESSTIEHNEAYDEGGGIAVGWDGQARIVHSRILENRAGEEEGSGWGGGIFIAPYASVSIDLSSVDGNSAGAEGGGVFVDGSTYDDCGVRAAHTSEKPLAAFGGNPLKPADEEGEEESETATPELAVEQSTIEGNTVEEGVGGGIRLYVAPCGGYGIAKASTATERRASFRAARASRAKASGATRATGPGARPATEQLSEPEMLISQSTIAKNRAEGFEEYTGEGGGIYEEAWGGEPEYDPIVNSTITENFATYTGGGVAISDELDELISDTVYDNTIEPEIAEEEGEEGGSEDARHAARGARRAGRDVLGDEEPTPGGNLYVNSEEEFGALYLRDTIVAEPKGSEVGNCEGFVTSLLEGEGFNLDYPSTPAEGGSGDTCGMSKGEADLVGVEPKFEGGLQDNGGPTSTIALSSTSPAIGVVPVKENCESAETGPGLVDQRGDKRPGIAGDGCDIGAYEYQEEPPAEEEPVKEKEVPAPTPTPETKTTTTTTPPATTSTPAAGVSPFKIEAPAQCTSKRDIKIHIQNVKQFGIVSAVVSIDGKHRRTLKGKQLSTSIDLVGLPKGTFTIEIVAYTRSGHTLHGKRVYHTCHTKLPGRSYIPL